MVEDTFVTQKNSENVHVKYSRIKRKVLRHVWLVRIFLITLLVVGLVGAYIIGTGIFKDLGIGNIADIVSSFAFPDDQALQSDGGRVNILVMGVGGKGHEGAELTDTVLLASISLKKNNVEVISVPRDVWIPQIRAKINSAYYWGNQKSAGGGLSLAKSSVSDVLGLKPQYAAVIDFSGFKNIVDELDGIDVNVEKGFTDTLYPIAGKENDLCEGDKTYACRYESITFDPGIQSMNGETALKFVRSRHAEGDEGTDTARQSRQQKVIEAIKNKLLTPGIFLNPKKSVSIWKAVVRSIETDMDANTTALIARKLFDARDSIETNLIPKDLLINPPITPAYDKQYVFIPASGSGNWKEINDWAQSVVGR